MKRTPLQTAHPVFPLVLAALVAAWLLAAPQGLEAAKAASSNPLSGDEQAIQEGKTLYRAVCVVCHGMRANGRGRGIAGASNLQKFKRGYTLYVDIVKNGKKKMPPYGGGRVLSDAEIDQIGAYLETLAVRGAVWIDPE
ncbi:MAG: cytochrome c [Candidatus Tectomicrobia bacterium]|nr:cytochrome c [Candidatus Tectomicrobia bacterium]